MSISRHTTYNLIGSIIPIVLSLVTVPLYLHLVGSERYGVLAIAWLLLGYFGLFDLGLGRATSFRIAALKGAAPEARATTFWAALTVNVAMGLAGALVLWLAAGFFFGRVFKVDAALRQEMILAVPLLAASVPVATMTGVLTGAMQGREQFLRMNVVSVTSTALFQLLPLAIAWLVSPNLSLLLIGALGARILAGCVMAVFCHQEITRGHPVKFERREAVELLKYGGWVNLTSIVGPVLYMIDRFTIGSVMGARAVTDYTVPFQLATRTAILPSALMTALFPRLSSAGPEEREALANTASLAIISLLGLPFLGGIYIMGPFLQVWVGQQLGAEAPWVGRIVLIAMWANALALVSFTRLQASGRPDIVSKIMVLEIPPYFLILFAGVKLFGLVGCALATAARSLMDYLLLTWFAGRGYTGWRIVLANFAVLSLGAWCAGQWPLTDWRWWASGAALAAISFGLAAITIPKEVRERLLERARALLPAS